MKTPYLVNDFHSTSPYEVCANASDKLVMSDSNVMYHNTHLCLVTLQRYEINVNVYC